MGHKPSSQLFLFSHIRNDILLFFFNHIPVTSNNVRVKSNKQTRSDTNSSFRRKLSSLPICHCPVKIVVKRPNSGPIKLVLRRLDKHQHVLLFVTSCPRQAITPFSVSQIVNHDSVKFFKGHEITVIRCVAVVVFTIHEGCLSKSYQEVGVFPSFGPIENVFCVFWLGSDYG